VPAGDQEEPRFSVAGKAPPTLHKNFSNSATKREKAGEGGGGRTRWNTAAREEGRRLQSLKAGGREIERRGTDLE